MSKFDFGEFLEKAAIFGLSVVIAGMIIGIGYLAHENLHLNRENKANRQAIDSLLYKADSTLSSVNKKKEIRLDALGIELDTIDLDLKDDNR